MSLPVMRRSRAPLGLDLIEEILGINMRNALIAKYNPRIVTERARDKVAAKVALKAAGIACTGTIAVLEDYQALMAFKPEEKTPEAWAIKPTRGSQGDGILLAVRREGDIWHKGSGTPLSATDIINHINKIIDGGFSGDSASEEAALIEPLIIEVNAHPGIEIQNICQLGLKAQMAQLGETFK